MKQLIRKWLGVQDVDTSKFIKIDDVKKEVETAMYEAFQAELTGTGYWLYNNHYTVRGTLQKCVNRLVCESVDGKVRSRIDEIIAPEKFIDDVVVRIKSKQLNT
jgi:hypothetical protein